MLEDLDSFGKQNFPDLPFGHLSFVEYEASSSAIFSDDFHFFNSKVANTYHYPFSFSADHPKDSS